MTIGPGDVRMLDEGYFGGGMRGGFEGRFSPTQDTTEARLVEKRVCRNEKREGPG